MDTAVTAGMMTIMAAQGMEDMVMAVVEVTAMATVMAEAVMGGMVAITVNILSSNNPQTETCNLVQKRRKRRKYSPLYRYTGDQGLTVQCISAIPQKPS
jgi:hypothetical protein